MAAVKCVLFLMVVNFLGSFVRGDTEVSCIFMESCILPCSFPVGDGLVIHWLSMTAVNNRESVHSYYKTKNWLTHQDQRFRGRTSLFRDQISRGNASLQLTEVEVRDEGRYRCYASTRTGYNESFINLRVDAPVHEVNFQKVENRIICSSDGIYPEPELTWSINPPSSLTLQSTTKVQWTEQQLYNISSSLMLSDNVTDLDYICTISTHTNSRRASLIRQKSSKFSVWVVGAILCVVVVLGVYKYWNKVRKDRQTNQAEIGAPQTKGAPDGVSQSSKHGDEGI